MNDVIIRDSGAAPDQAAGIEPAPKLKLRRFQRWWDIHADAAKFSGKLEAFRKFDKGKMATLRRNAGETLATARGVAWFEGWLDENEYGRRYDEQYFLVATLFDLNRCPGIFSDMGTTLRLVKEKSSDSFERRFVTLLDAEFDSVKNPLDGSRSGGGELPYRLRQMVRLAASKEVGINWSILLADLCLWGDDGKPIQKAWARSFYAPHIEENTAASQSSLGEETHVN